MIVAVDYETYYHKKLCSVTVQGMQGYLRHPQFDAYMVSVVREDGVEFCGHPTEFDWDCIADDTWISHNKGFDASVHEYLIETEVIESPMPANWFCTADMTAYHGMPRALAAVLKFKYQHEMDKGIRDAMSGKTYESLQPKEREELIEYALDDSRWLLPLWKDLSPTWPDHERQISNRTIEMKNRGLPINEPKMEESIRTLRTEMFKSEELMPWWQDPKFKNKTPLSNVSMAAECTRRGIPAPASRAKEDPECIAWLETHGKKHKFVQAMQDWNSCNTLLQKLITMKDRTVERPDGTFWMPYGMKYCGTHTGRDSGGDGFNVLNFNKTHVFNVDIRSHIQAPKGFKFLNADYSQIEPRLLAWLVGDEKFIAAVTAGEDPYVAFGKYTLGHKGEWGPNDRNLWKVMVLQLGYQSGWEKFMNSALKYGVVLTPKEAKTQVTNYRRLNSKVRKFWKSKQREMIAASPGRGDGFLNYDLPSGRTQHYRQIQRLHGLSAIIADEYGWVRKHFYGGKLTENIIQALARDVFFDGYLRLCDRELLSVLRIYDEFLVLVPEEIAEEKQAEMLEIMRVAPAWAPDLPLDAECEIIDYYKK